MPKIDLITGFLGAGKTSFIKKYVQYLLGRGEMVGILENDYGAINIDMAFFEDLMGENCDVEMIVGGDGILSHVRRFRTKLIAMAMTGYDRVIVEPSGIYDVEEFFDAFAEEPLGRMYTPGSLISIVDAHLPEELSEESEYLLVSQSACAGRILLSHTGKDGHAEEAKDRILARLQRGMEHLHCDRRIEAKDIMAGDWEDLTEDDFAALADCGMVPASHVKIPMRQEGGYGTLFYYGTKMDEASLRRKIRETFGDPACGHVMRIKGFVRTGEGTRMQVNATPAVSEVKPTIFAQEVLIVTGENLCRSRIDAIWAPDSDIITPGDRPM